MSDFANQCHLLGFAQSTIVKEPIYSGRGRPKKDEKPTGYHYLIDATPYTDLEKVKLAKLKVGMFILATNDTDNTDLTMVALLEHYKTTTEPTARWVFLKFEGIDTLEFGGQSFIKGVQEHQTRLLKLLGVLYEVVYS